MSARWGAAPETCSCPPRGQRDHSIFLNLVSFKLDGVRPMYKLFISSFISMTSDESFCNLSIISR